MFAYRCKAAASVLVSRPPVIAVSHCFVTEWYRWSSGLRTRPFSSSALCRAPLVRTCHSPWRPPGGPTAGVVRAAAAARPRPMPLGRGDAGGPPSASPAGHHGSGARATGALGLFGDGHSMRIYKAFAVIREELDKVLRPGPR